MSAISHDCRRLVTEDYGVGQLILWDAESGHQIAALDGSSSNSQFSRDGKLVLTFDPWKKVFRVWDADSGKQIATLSGHTGPKTSVQVNAAFIENSRVATKFNDGIRLWNVAKATTDLHHTSSVAAAINSDGKRVVTAS